ncbi:MAG: general secretion pathway protein GspB [Mariprofundus sp.]|nr:general secretion pathway protein GspB [Mariprofundus sp.]
MSYILDALKKSEEKRGKMPLPVQQPAFAPEHAYRKRRFGLSIILLMAALLIGWCIAQWQQEPNQKHASATASIAVKEVSRQDIVEKNRPATAEVKTVEPLLVTETLAPSTAVDRPAPVIDVEEQQPVFRPVTPASPVRDIHAVRVSDDAGHTEAAANVAIQSLHDLPIAVQQSMPEIKIEGHIYDIDPHARMVIINGLVRKEKHSIGSGLRLQEITSDGVIINYKGDLFHIGVFD